MPKNNKISTQKQQGFINYYRKPFLVIGIAVITGLGLFTAPLPYFQISEPTNIYLEKIGLVLFFLGLIARIFASLSIASYKNELIIKTELYSIVRNPLYVASLLILLGMTLFLMRADLMVAIIVLFILCFYPIILNEEKFLVEKFGQEYLDYKKSVPRIMPNPFKWNHRPTINIQFALVCKTFLDVMIMLCALIIIEFVAFVF